MNDHDTKSMGTGSWVLLIFLVVVALHVVAILGIAAFNGWKWGGSEPQARNTTVPPNDISTSIPENGAVIGNSTVLPAGDIKEPAKIEKVEKISSTEQSALEKEILSKPDPEDEESPAIPENAISAPKKEDTAKTDEKAAAVEEKLLTKTSVKPPANSGGAKTAGSDTKTTTASEGHASTSAKEKSTSAKTATAGVGTPKKSATPLPPAAEAYAMYTVQKGDTLNKIAREFNTSLDTLAKINSIKDPSALKAGTVLKVPKK